ncbi:MAG: putative glyoxalase superfamily protein PhnB [Planctomycetota bacterium]|jgi:uncharacterized glyoxalase superfamily protein PhnB
MNSKQLVSSHIYPSLTYEDAPAAIDWLCRTLGFKQRLVVPAEDGEVRHSELSLGSSVVMVSSPRPEAGRVSRLGAEATSFGLSLFVEDPDAHYERAIAAGATNVEPPTDTPFGARGYTISDPEGFSWFFANYRPGAYWAEDSLLE